MKVGLHQGSIESTAAWGHSGDGCIMASTLCKYTLRNDDLFDLSWARVRRVRR